MFDSFTQSVEITPLDEGIFVYVKDIDDIESTVKEIEEKLERLKVIFGEEDSIGLIIIEQPSMDKLMKILSVFEKENIKLFEIRFGKPAISKKKKTEKIKEIPKYTETMFLKKNIRSGQKIEFDGDVILMGNLNLGAEIRAGGNIIVYGLARGSLIAGLNTGDKAFVAALDFRPSLLKIGEYAITGNWNGGPVMAFVRNGRVVFEKYSFESKSFLEKRKNELQEKGGKESEVEL